MYPSKFPSPQAAALARPSTLASFHFGFRFLILGMALLWAYQAAGQAGYQPGDVARTFKLQNVDGSWISPADFPDAKGFIVVFTCNNCPYAKMYEERITALDKAFSAKGFPVIAINPNDAETHKGESLDEMKKRAKAKGFTFPYLQDATQDIARAYGAKRTPEVYLLEKKGDQLIVRYTGAIDDNPSDPAGAKQKYVEEAIKAVQKGDQVASPTTKSVGCTIKWKTT